MEQLTFSFWQAARQAEIQALKQLVCYGQLVSEISHFIHQLQRERGISNIFLASSAALFAKERRQQQQCCEQAEQQLRGLLHKFYRQTQTAAQHSRLLSHITLALQGGDHLAALRRQIQQQKVTALQATEAFSRLIAAWLAVVLESADLSCDAAITRLLVALFHLLQSKEYAGQERAWGAFGLASGNIDAALAQRLLLLQQAQQHSATVFLQFAGETALQQWQQLELAPDTLKFQQCRLLLQQLAGGTAPVPEISDLWYQFASHRIDQMQQIQAGLSQQLKQLTEQQLQRSSSQYQQQTAQQLSQPGQHTESNLLSDASMPGLLGALPLPEAATAPLLQAPGSFYQLLSEQAQYIRQMQLELSAAKQAITEQKLINRAKLLLMQQQKQTEEQAYRQLQQQAMQQQCRIATIAEQVLHSFQVLQSGG